MYYAKTDEPIEMLFRGLTCGPKEPCITLRSNLNESIHGVTSRRCGLLPNFFGQLLSYANWYNMTDGYAITRRASFETRDGGVTF